MGDRYEHASTSSVLESSTVVEQWHGRGLSLRAPAPPSSCGQRLANTVLGL